MTDGLSLQQSGRKWEEPPGQVRQLRVPFAGCCQTSISSGAPPTTTWCRLGRPQSLSLASSGRGHLHVFAAQLQCGACGGFSWCLWSKLEIGWKSYIFLHWSFWHFLLFRSSSRSCGVWHCKVVNTSSRDMAEHIYSKFPNHPEEPWVWSHWGRKTWMFVLIMWIWVNLDVKLIRSQILKVMTIEAFHYIYI